MPLPPLKDVDSHWHKLIGDFETSPKNFYAAVSASLERRRIPRLKTLRVIWNEGGVLSPNREYLRLTDGRVEFDLCAAPFGTGYFFSWWLVQKRVRWVGLYSIVFAVAAVLVRHGLFYAVWGLELLTPKWAFWNLWLFDRPQWLVRRLPQLPDILHFPQSAFGVLLWGLTAIIVFWLVAMLARIGKRSPEGALLRIPVFGPAYARLFRPETYHSLDSALMFRSAVHSAVLEVIDGLSTQKGLRALTEDERKPVLHRFM